MSFRRKIQKDLPPRNYGRRSMEIIDMGDIFLADFDEEQELGQILWPEPAGTCSSVYDS